LINRLLYHSCLLFACILVACSGKNKLPSFKETYAYNDKNPFGTQVMYQQLNQFFYHNDVKVRKTNLQKTFSGNYDTGAVYISVSKNFYLSTDEVNSMLSFVSNGNTMFIASHAIDTLLLKELDITMGQQSFFEEDAISSLQQTAVKLLPAHYSGDSTYGYFYLPFKNYFEHYPNERLHVLGKNENGSTNFIVLFYGKGRIYLHSEPRAFSNYFLLKNNNYQYLQQVVSFMPSVPEHYYWDDFYNKRNRPVSGNQQKKGLAVLLQYPAMAWAFGLVVSLLLLFIIFDGKRRQRIVKPLPPNINTSVAFTQTVSRLYLQKKDNRNIADKMITYFAEQLRNQYFINIGQVSNEAMDVLSRKSNVPITEVKKLFGSIAAVQQTYDVTDQQLLKLNQQIENFYKHKK
jgi:hypothetical protein